MDGCSRMLDRGHLIITAGSVYDYQPTRTKYHKTKHSIRPQGALETHVKSVDSGALLYLANARAFRLGEWLDGQAGPWTEEWESKANKLSRDRLLDINW